MNGWLEIEGGLDLRSLIGLLNGFLKYYCQYQRLSRCIFLASDRMIVIDRELRQGS